MCLKFSQGNLVNIFFSPESYRVGALRNALGRELAALVKLTEYTRENSNNSVADLLNFHFEAN